MDKVPLTTMLFINHLLQGYGTATRKLKASYHKVLSSKNLDTKLDRYVQKSDSVDYAHQYNHCLNFINDDS